MSIFWRSQKVEVIPWNQFFERQKEPKKDRLAVLSKCKMAVLTGVISVDTFLTTFTDTARAEGTISKNFDLYVKPYVMDFLEVVTWCMIAYGIYKYIRAEDSKGKEIAKKAAIGYIIIQFLDIGMDLLNDIGAGIRHDVKVNGGIQR